RAKAWRRCLPSSGQQVTSRLFLFFTWLIRGLSTRTGASLLWLWREQRMFSEADILEVTRKVTKEWTRQRKAEERGSRSRSSREYIYSGRVNFTDVADEILPGAYQHASGNGRYTANKRQIYYACREAFKERTTRELSYSHFANTLLVQYV